jgi:acetyl-CoA acetyltransferase
MNEVFVLATAGTRFGRHSGTGFRSLTEEVVRAVLTDSGLGAGGEEALGQEIGTVWFGNCLMHAWGQPNIRGQVATVGLVDAGVLRQRVPVTNVESACATGSVALHGAIKDIRSGETDVALAVGVEKMVLDDAAAAGTDVFTLLEGSTDNLDRSRLEAVYRDAAEDVGATFETGPGRSMFMDTYAVQALEHMKRFGTTQEQIARGAAKNHNYGAQNPLAHHRFTSSVEEVLADRLVAYPYTRSMCAPISDGAAAALVVSADWLAAQPEAVRTRAVRVRATAATGGGYARGPEAPTLTHAAAELAYRRAGITAADLDVVELHDATSFGEILQVEMLGLCPRGQGGAFVAGGATGPGGEIPVNTSGGLVSKGHPIGATGLSMVHEVVTQLRGEAGPRQVDDARIGLVENGGGVLGLEEAACAVTILERSA